MPETLREIGENIAGLIDVGEVEATKFAVVVPFEMHDTLHAVD